MTRQKKKTIIGLAIAFLVLGAFVSTNLAAKSGEKTEKDVTIDQVPAAVKATILKEAGDNKIEEIEEVSRDGTVVYYAAEWKRGGKEIEIKGAPDGKLLSKEIEDVVFGYGPLQDLLRAPTVTEIMVVGSDQIYVEQNGIIERSGRNGSKPYSIR